MNSGKQFLPDTAFTRLDLLAALVVLALLAAVVRPALAGLHPRSGIAVCSNNLRQIGRAIELWSNDRGGARPWNVSKADGGTRGQASGLTSQAWFQYLCMSNELATPRILVCPSDSGKSVASVFVILGGSDGLNSFKNYGVSYFLGADAPSAAALPTALLAGDRNLTYDGLSTCAIGINGVEFFYSGSAGMSLGGWTNSLPYPIGIVLLNDGRVLETSTTVLRRQVLPTAGDDNGVIHVISPRGTMATSEL